MDILFSVLQCLDIKEIVGGPVGNVLSVLFWGVFSYLFFDKILLKLVRRLAPEYFGKWLIKFFTALNNELEKAKKDRRFKNSIAYVENYLISVLKQCIEILEK